MSVEKIAAIKAKRLAKKRQTIKMDSDGNAVRMQVANASQVKYFIRTRDYLWSPILPETLLKRNGITRQELMFY